MFSFCKNVVVLVFFVLSAFRERLHFQFGSRTEMIKQKCVNGNVYVEEEETVKIKLQIHIENCSATLKNLKIKHSL